MRSIIIAISCLLIGQQLIGQDEYTFGEVSLKELKMKVYEKDSEAKALVLCDIGYTDFIEGKNNYYDVRFKRHKRIKIFDKNEDHHGTVSIPYYSDGFGRKEFIKNLKAFTYNYVDGKIEKKRVDPEMIFEERLNEKYYIIKFTFPDLQDGSVIEFQYEKTTPFIFSLPKWRFQSDIPTYYSEYTVHVVPRYEYAYILNGIEEFDVYLSKKYEWNDALKAGNMKIINEWSKENGRINTYGLYDTPAFEDESYVHSAEDYLMTMDFQLSKIYRDNGVIDEVMTSWPKLNTELLDHDNFGRYLKQASRISKTLLKEELNLENLSVQDKAKRIIQYMKDKYSWDGSMRKLTSQSAKDFQEKGIGNAADINLFMIGLMKAAEIDVKPVILSTRKHGDIPVQYPIMNFTNYVLALVETEVPFFADATEPLLSYDMIPLRCMNDLGLVVEKSDKANWLYMQNSISSSEKKTINLTLDVEDLEVDYMTVISSSSFDAYKKKKDFEDDSSALEDYYEGRMGTIEKLRTSSYDNSRVPYVIGVQGSFAVDRLGKNLILKPFLNLPLQKNSLTKEKRDYPIEFDYLVEDFFTMSLPLPEGYRVENLPESLDIDDEQVKIKLDYSIKGNVLSAKGGYYFKKVTYQADEYDQIKKYFDKIVEYFNQEVLIETD